MPAATAGAVTSFALTTTCIAEVSRGERVLDAVVGLHDRLVLRERVGERRLPRSICVAGIARATSTAVASPADSQGGAGRGR